MLKTAVSGLLLLILILEGNNLPVIKLEPVIALAISLSVRFTFNWSNNTITIKNTIQRLIYAVCLSYFMLFVWRDFQIQKNIIYTIAVIGLISAEMVNEVTKLAEMGFKSYVRKWLNNLIAKDDRI